MMLDIQENLVLQIKTFWYAFTNPAHTLNRFFYCRDMREPALIRQGMIIKRRQ